MIDIEKTSVPECLEYHHLATEISSVIAVRQQHELLTFTQQPCRSISPLRLPGCQAEWTLIGIKSRQIIRRHGMRSTRRRASPRLKIADSRCRQRIQC